MSRPDRTAGGGGWRKGAGPCLGRRDSQRTLQQVEYYSKGHFIHRLYRPCPPCNKAWLVADGYLSEVEVAWHRGGELKKGSIVILLLYGVLENSYCFMEQI